MNNPSTSWPADKIIKRKTAELTPYARNARQHSQAQIAQIAASIKEWGWTQPIIIDEDGGILAGHGRLLAAHHLGIEEVPCVMATGWSEAKRRAYVIADNRLTETGGGWDIGMLSAEVQELSELGFDLELTGFEGDDLSKLLDGTYGDDGDAEQDDTYTRKIEAPIYEPNGEKPDPSELFDDTKARELREEIEQADIPEDIKQFLRVSADRHIVFNFRKIADFYAHSDEPVQDLMEKSALIIIDFNKAIENGFVNISEKIMSQYGKDYPEGDEGEE